jgi:hypothetical protein
MTGFELSRGIRQTHPNIDVILTSGVAGAAAEGHDQETVPPEGCGIANRDFAGAAAKFAT